MRGGGGLERVAPPLKRGNQQAAIRAACALRRLTKTAAGGKPAWTWGRAAVGEREEGDRWGRLGKARRAAMPSGLRRRGTADVPRPARRVARGPDATKGFGRKRSRQGGEGVWGAMGLGELCRSVWASDFAS